MMSFLLVVRAAAEPPSQPHCAAKFASQSLAHVLCIEQTEKSLFHRTEGDDCRIFKAVDNIYLSPDYIALGENFNPTTRFCLTRILQDQKQHNQLTRHT